MATTTQIMIELVLHECPSCGIAYGISRQFEDRRRSDKKSFYCPNGHSLSYSGVSDENRIKQLEAELLHEKNVVGIRRAELKSEKAAHRRTVGKLGATSKKLKRVDNGVCPECNRSFKNVNRHMKSKHQ